MQNVVEGPLICETMQGGFKTFEGVPGACTLKDFDGLPQASLIVDNLVACKNTVETRVHYWKRLCVSLLSDCHTF